MNILSKKNNNIFQVYALLQKKKHYNIYKRMFNIIKYATSSNDLAFRPKTFQIDGAGIW